MNLLNGCFERRPEASTLFHFLNAVLRYRGICKNILLSHEGECPDWIKNEALKALELCKGARELTDGEVLGAGWLNHVRW